MSLNSALNAAVALIEGRTEIAKQILRGPNSDVKNVPDILARLERAVDMAAAKTIRHALVATLSVVPDPKKIAGASAEELFYMGAAAVEKVLEDTVYELEHHPSGDD